MLSKVVIKDYFDKGTVNLHFNGDPLILTGDNGSGKTTIIDTIYSALIGHFEKLLCKKFSELTIYFNHNNKSLERLVVEKNNNFLKIKYCIREKDLILTLINDSKDSYKYYFNHSIDEIIENEIKLTKKEFLTNNKMESFDNIEELLREEKEMSFLLEIGKSLLYFPTYRRIDLDLESYFSASLGTNDKYSKRRFRFFQEELMEIDKNSLQDRRVIGVGDKDIYDLFKSYSEKVNKFKSGNLSELLTNFVKVVIEEVSNNEMIRIDESNKIKVEFKTTNNNHQDTYKHLIGLAELLDIGIQKDKIEQYFKEKEEIQKVIDSEIGKIRGESGKGKRGDKLKKDINKLLPFALFSNIIEDRYILKLSNLYSSFQQNLDEVLSPFRYLEKNMDFFFNGKLAVKLTNDNQIRIEKNGEEYPFVDLSTGEKQLITLFAYCGLDLNNDFPAFVLIDEPELSLHVKWQVGLLQKLVENKDMQLMVSTHSPYILNQLYMNSTVKLGDISE